MGWDSKQSVVMWDNWLEDKFEYLTFSKSWNLLTFYINGNKSLDISLLEQKYLWK